MKSPRFMKVSQLIDSRINDNRNEKVKKEPRDWPHTSRSDAAMMNTDKAGESLFQNSVKDLW